MSDRFVPMFPTPTAGNGRVVASNRRNGAAQGRPSPNKRVSCGACGFAGTDLTKHGNTGGDYNGDGAGGTVTKTAANSDGGPHGDQAYRRGAGCPLCFSPNYAVRMVGKADDVRRALPHGFEKL